MAEPLISMCLNKKATEQKFRSIVRNIINKNPCSQFIPELWPCHPESKIIKFDKVQFHTLKSLCKSVENTKALHRSLPRCVRHITFQCKDAIAQRRLGIIPWTCTPFGGANGKCSLLNTICEGTHFSFQMLQAATSFWCVWLWDKLGDSQVSTWSSVSWPVDHLTVLLRIILCFRDLWEMEREALCSFTNICETFANFPLCGCCCPQIYG